MPDGDDPDGLPFDPIEEPIGRNQDLSKREIGELGQRPSGLRVGSEPPEHPFRPAAESLGRSGVVTLDVRDDGEELAPSRWREADRQRSVFGEEPIGFGEDLVEIVTPALGDLALPPRQQAKKLALVLAPLIGLDAEHDRSRPAALGNDDRLPGAANPLEGFGRVLTEVRDRDNLWNSRHKHLLKYVQEYAIR